MGEVNKLSSHIYIRQNIVPLALTHTSTKKESLRKQFSFRNLPTQPSASSKTLFLTDQLHLRLKMRFATSALVALAAVAAPGTVEAGMMNKASKPEMKEKVEHQVKISALKREVSSAHAANTKKSKKAAEKSSMMRAASISSDGEVTLMQVDADKAHQDAINTEDRTFLRNNDDFDTTDPVSDSDEIDMMNPRVEVNAGGDFEAVNPPTQVVADKEVVNTGKLMERR